MTAANQIENWAAKHSVVLPDAFVTKLNKFKELIYLWNTKHNLTRIQESDFEAFHIIDSLTIALHWQPSKSTDRIVDIGTGAGFPGIPLALLWPDIQCTLVDKSRKRIIFLEQVVASLSLSNVYPVHGRLEDLAAADDYAAAFSLVTSRALAPLPSLLPLAVPFAAENGTVLCLKSHAIFEELKDVSEQQLERLGISDVNQVPYLVPGRSEEDYIFSAKRKLSPLNHR